MGSFFFTSNTWMWSLSLFPFMVGAGKTSLLLSFPLPYLQLSLQLAETTSTTPLYWNYSGITHKRPLSCHIQCMLFTLRIFFLHFLAFDSVGFSILRTPSYLSSSNILFFKYHSPDTSFLVSFSARLLIVYMLQSFVLGPVFLSVYSFCLLPVYDFSYLLFLKYSFFLLCHHYPTVPAPEIWMQLYEILFCLRKPSKYQVLLIMPLITACAIPFIISFVDAKLLTISLSFTVFPNALPYVKSSLSLVLAVMLASLK